MLYAQALTSTREVLAPAPMEDGIFGHLTRAAVVEFQRSHGLTADGIVGPKTWRALEATEMQLLAWRER